MKLKKIFTEVILTLLVISGTTLTYALLSDLKVSSGNTLTSTLWNNLVDHSVPTGAVMSFDLETCPTGWSEYTTLRGKFIRGADTGAVNDPDFATRSGGTGARKIGSTQGDSTKLLMNGASGGNNPEGNSSVGIITHKPNVEMVGIEATFWGVYVNRVTLRGAMDTTYGGGLETRPKNVYLLYCRKN